jgi:hypothetical protein
VGAARAAERVDGSADGDDDGLDGAPDVEGPPTLPTCGRVVEGTNK